MRFTEKRRRGNYSAITLLALAVLVAGASPTVAGQRHVSPSECTTSFGGSVRVAPSVTVNGGSVEFDDFGFNSGTAVTPCDVTGIAARFCCPAMNGQPVSGCNDLSEVCGTGCTLLSCPDDHLAGTGDSIICSNPGQANGAVTCVINTFPGTLVANGRLLGGGIAHSSPDDLPALAILPAGVAINNTPTPTSTPTITPTPTPECGNGIVETGEACDDGNTVGGDCCSADCTGISERPDCGNCSDGADNDSDDDIDADDADCATLSEAQHFALIGRAVNGKNVVLGSGVEVRSNLPGSLPPLAPAFPLGQSRGGVCAGRARLITSVQISGAFAAGDSQRVTFGTGQDVNIGATYAVGPLTATVLTGVAPVVGPGNCSDAGTAVCTLDAQCALPATCEGLFLNDPGNLNVDTSGTHEEFVRCAEAKLAMVADEAYLYGLPLSDGAYGLGPINHVPGAPQPIPTLSGPGPHILKIERLRVSPGALLTVTADDPNAVVVIQVDGALLIGKTGAVQVAGLLQAQNLLWVAHGKGSVKINGSASFVGTVLAPERSIKLGQYIRVDGALLGNKVSIAGLSAITHLPFAPLL